MATYNSLINDTEAGSLIPEEISSEIIKSAPAQSIMLTKARQVRMSRKQKTQPVMSTLPDAYWVNGNTGMKQTSNAAWDNLTITAEELATLVVIPDAIVDDSAVPLWDEVKPYLTEAIGRKVDQACLFGVDKPASFPDDIVTAATAAGNVSQVAAKNDIGVAAATVGEMLATQGFAVNGFAGRPGLNWKLTSLRDANNQPIYTPAGAMGGANLYGFPLDSVQNGSWDATAAELIAADWDKFIVGVRQDITFSIHEDGIISDETGKVIFNAMQQDAKIMRVVFRVGFQTANPANALGGGYPAGLVTPAAAG